MESKFEKLTQFIKNETMEKCPKKREEVLAILNERLGVASPSEISIGEYMLSSQNQSGVQTSEAASLETKYDIIELLGVGAFGVVLLVTNLKNGALTALKIVNKQTLGKTAVGLLRQEAKILQQLKHPSIVTFIDIFETDKYIFMEMEYIRGGTLRQAVQDGLSEKQVREIMKAVLEGVNFIHKSQFIHRDLKPDNILLASKGSSQIKIVDFGLSAVFRTADVYNNSYEKFGTLLYMAPEQAKSKQYSKRVDMWAVGITMYNLLSGGLHPIHTKGMTHEQYIEKLQKQKHNHWKFPDTFSKLARDFFSKLCKFQSIDRYDTVTALKHPWITGDHQADIPLTHKEKLQRYDAEVHLKKAVNLTQFMSIIMRPQSANMTSKEKEEFEIYKTRIHEISTQDSSEGQEIDSFSLDTINSDKIDEKVEVKKEKQQKDFVVKKVKKITPTKKSPISRPQEAYCVKQIQPNAESAYANQIGAQPIVQINRKPPIKRRGSNVENYAKPTQVSEQKIKPQILSSGRSDFRLSQQKRVPSQDEKPVGLFRSDSQRNSFNQKDRSTPPPNMKETTQRTVRLDKKAPSNSSRDDIVPLKTDKPPRPWPTLIRQNSGRTPIIETRGSSQTRQGAIKPPFRSGQAYPQDDKIQSNIILHHYQLNKMKFNQECKRLFNQSIDQQTNILNVKGRGARFEYQERLGLRARREGTSLKRTATYQ